MASFLVAINPNILITNRLILSEPIFNTFLLSAFIVFYFFKEKPLKYLFLGLLSGFASLTRPEGFFLIFIYIFFLKKRSFLSVFLITFSFSLLFLPYFLLNYFNQSFYGYNLSHFRIYHFSEGMNEGFEKIYPPVFTFIIDNFSWTVMKIFNNFIYNLKSLINFAFLGPLIFVLLLSLKNFKRFMPLLCFSFSVLVFFSVVWSAFSEPERHLIPVYQFLLLPIFAISQKIHFNRVIFIICLIFTFLAYFMLDFHRLNWARELESKTDPWGPHQKRQVYQWIINHTNKGDIIASPNPWLVYLFTERPSILLPANLDSNKKYQRFIDTFNVNCLIAENKSYYKLLNEKAVLDYKAKDLRIYSIK